VIPRFSEKGKTLDIFSEVPYHVHGGASLRKELIDLEGFHGKEEEVITLSLSRVWRDFSWTTERESRSMGGGRSTASFSDSGGRGRSVHLISLLPQRGGKKAIQRNGLLYESPKQKLLESYAGRRKVAIHITESLSRRCEKG